MIQSLSHSLGTGPLIPCSPGDNVVNSPISWHGGFDSVPDVLLDLPSVQYFSIKRLIVSGYHDKMLNFSLVFFRLIFVVSLSGCVFFSYFLVKIEFFQIFQKSSCSNQKFEVLDFYRFLSFLFIFIRIPGLTPLTFFLACIGEFD